MPELFRKEAVDHSVRRLAGEVVLASPLSFKLLAIFFSTIIVVALLFASLSSYARKETVSGWIVPRDGLIRVVARQGGVIESLPEPEGSKVSAGAPLAVLRLSTDLESGDAGMALVRDLSAETTAAAAAGYASENKLKAQYSEMVARRAALRRELAELRGRIETMQSRQVLAQNDVDREEKLLAKGFGAPQTLDRLRSTALGAAQDTSQARSSALELERQIGDLNSELAAMPADLANVEAQAAQSQASLAQRRTTALAQNAVIATAPINGQVATILVERGQVVPPGATIAVLTPKGSVLTAELFVPSKAAGFIKVGQEVRLKYQAFPYQTFGAARGMVSSVSSTVLAPNEVQIPGVTMQEPVFRVRVKLASLFVQAYRRAVPLQPGMLLTADVVIDRRSLIQWLLDPLYAVGRRA